LLENGSHPSLTLEGKTENDRSRQSSSGNTWRALINEGVNDVLAALRNSYVATVFGGQDVAARYRRSKLGAFWITISVAVMIATLSFVFGALFHVPLHEFLPFVAIGLILWGFISSTISESCVAFVEASGVILQIRLPLFTHIMRVVWRNMMILAHNIVILPIVFLAFQFLPGPALILAVPGFAVLLINVVWMALILAVLTARFRDITQATQNILQIAFFLTPIMWMPSSAVGRVPQSLLELNPFFHLLAIVRDPLLGHAPSVLNWAVSIVLAIVGWIVALLFFGRFHKRVPYWL
jgi:ABC-type polysaccharide/polyol phosphate export permease